jgi:glycosyltransferase involved in cell wall biosynthesis
VSPAAKSPSERVSAVVCTRNRPGLLDSCLAGFLRLDPPARELIVVDQSDGDESGRVVERYLGHIPRLRHLPTLSRGLSRARNEAIRAASSDILAFTDDDCVVRSDWIGAVAAAFVEEPDLAAVTGGSLPESNGGLEARRVAITTWHYRNRRHFRRPVDPAEVGGGFNLSIRRAWAEKVGLFDPDLGPGARFRGADDTDFIHRILRAGGVIRYDPGVVVAHLPWRDSATQTDVELEYGHGIAVWAMKWLAQGDLFPARIAFRVMLGQGRRVVSGVARRDRDAIRTGRAYLSGLARGAAHWFHDRLRARRVNTRRVTPGA